MSTAIPWQEPNRVRIWPEDKPSAARTTGSFSACAATETTSASASFWAKILTVHEHAGAGAPATGWLPTSHAFSVAEPGCLEASSPTVSSMHCCSSCVLELLSHAWCRRVWHARPLTSSRHSCLRPPPWAGQLLTCCRERSRTTTCTDAYQQTLCAATCSEAPARTCLSCGRPEEELAPARAAAHCLWEGSIGALLLKEGEALPAQAHRVKCMHTALPANLVHCCSLRRLPEAPTRQMICWGNDSCGFVRASMLPAGLRAGCLTL